MNDPLDIFAKTARRLADHPAIIAGGVTLNYTWLHDRAASYAALVARHKSPRVLIYMPKCADAYAAVLGTGFGGGVYSLIHVNMPIGKLQPAVEMLSPDIILTDATHARAIRALAPGAALYTPAALPAKMLESTKRIARHQSAYILFTCDPSGKMRGIDVSRQALSNYIGWIQGTFKLTKNDRVAQFVDLSIDISVTDLYGAICAGATLVVPDGEIDLRNPAAFIERHDITVLNTFPSQIELMAESGLLTTYWLGSLKLVNLCRHVARKTHVDMLFAEMPELQILITYGPPEATVATTYQRLTAETCLEAYDDIIPLGKPLPLMTVALSCQPGQELGELIISGPQLASAYESEDIDTARMFRRNEDGNRILRTRDIFRRDGLGFHFCFKAARESVLVG